MTFLLNWLHETWVLLLDSGPLFVLGLLLAGVISVFIRNEQLKAFIGKGKTAALRGALVGVPLPLCSCSTLPMAAQLRQAGVGKGGTVAFLVATPETGVDSILLTWSLTDPLLTVIRPVVAFISAFFAGWLEESVGEKEKAPQVALQTPIPDCTDGCGCAEEKHLSSRGSRLFAPIRFAATELLADLAPYLFLGYLAAGLISALLHLSAGDLPAALTHGWMTYVGALVVGIPLYVCATSSTPLAATLLAAGFSPGAILVFLLVGPATNIVSLATLRKIIGGRSTLRYLAVITVVAVLSGLVADWLYNVTGMAQVYRSMSEEGRSGWLTIFSAGLLSLGILYYTARHLLRRFR